MRPILRHVLGLAAATTLTAAGAAHATQLCGWLTEKVEADDVHKFDLYLQADGEVSFLYKMTGEGLTSEGRRSYSPSGGSFTLHGGDKPQHPWGYGSNIPPPGDVDIVAEIHVAPKSIFDEGDTPLLAKFVFRRHVPEGEKKPPTDFQKHQCVALAPPAPN